MLRCDVRTGDDVVVFVAVVFAAAFCAAGVRVLVAAVFFSDTPDRRGAEIDASVTGGGSVLLLR